MTTGIQLGPYRIEGRVLLAPMAGVTDLPFRRLCRRMGAALAAGEMLSADERLWNTELSRRRRDHTDEPEPRIVQIAGGEPVMLADAARRNVDAGAQIIDVNMGCPAKKVCNRDAGSALLRDEGLVARLLAAVVRAVPVPVTLKMRTGWDPATRNAVRIAHIAEDSGVVALALHGRTRACRFEGEAEHRTIAEVKQQVKIPVYANGDIDSAEKAWQVLRASGADGLMIGRAAQGRPWIFREVEARLAGDVAPPVPRAVEVGAIMRAHLRDLYAFYGEAAGVRIARKHIGWYCRDRADARTFSRSVMQAVTASAQLAQVHDYFAALDGTNAAAAA
jgi:tRNA-dihydrouridine synthase B